MYNIKITRLCLAGVLLLPARGTGQVVKVTVSLMEMRYAFIAPNRNTNNAFILETELSVTLRTASKTAIALTDKSTLTVTVYFAKAPDTRYANRRHKFFRADARHLTSLTAFGDVRSRTSTRKTGTGFWRRLCGADFWIVCQGSKSG